MDITNQNIFAHTFLKSICLQIGPHLLATTRSLGQEHLGKAKFVQQLFKDCSRDVSGLHLCSIKLLNKDGNRENYKENSR